MVKANTDQRLTDLWKHEAALGCSRDEVFLRTLAVALGMNPNSDDDRDFVSEVWLALGSRDCREIPPPSIPGPTVGGALRLALRLHRLAERTVGEDDRLSLKIQKPVSTAEYREQVLRAREIKRDEQDQAIYQAVKREIEQNGKHGAFARVAQRLAGRFGGPMTSQNVGRRFRAWEARLSRDDDDFEQATMREAVKKRLLDRRK